MCMAVYRLTGTMKAECRSPMDFYASVARGERGAHGALGKPQRSGRRELEARPRYHEHCACTASITG